MKRAKHLMSRDLVYLHPGDSIFDAAKLFSQLDIHGLPVVKRGRLVGMITVTDIIKFIDIKTEELPELKGASVTQMILTIFKTLRSSEVFEKELQKISSTKVEDVMTTDIKTINQNTTFLEIARIMEANNVHRLPVTSRGRLIGMVTGVDLMKVLIEPPEKRKSRLTRIKERISRRPRTRKSS